ncbi:unnamed protein product [Chondrus crispus]|uniref:Uncharacterized protein n=1 Tax=Chondrus crispus TaxID=2769 RepID=R7QFW6_CHOCR|nr:unnamed protein product [Chondrus crispus]CDF36653.1 unnamed protein product [Chondrus crispus]|eukprot:XP_005716472.1 unnamed protein product [Chondrus crispus]
MCAFSQSFLLHWRNLNKLSRTCDSP